jgi:hypothetical protein
MDTIIFFVHKYWLKGILLNLLFLCVIVPASAEGNGIGSVKTYRPNAVVLHEGIENKVNVGTQIFKGDIIITQSDGAVGIIFIDGAVLSLGPDSKFIIDDFVFKPDISRFSFLSSILNGTASFISGAIGRMSPGSVKIKTPTATLGLRGTKILVSVD